jgi:hypothetical protein
LELGDVERQVLLADLVIGANHAAFQDRPETFDRIGMDRADHVLLGAVIYPPIIDVTVGQIAEIGGGIRRES